jgi:uncharacterized membrane protein
MWVVFSLSAAFFFALVHVLDEYCVDDVFEKPWFGVITSSMASIIVFQLIPFVAPFVDMTLPTLHVSILAFAAGVFIQTSQALYFKALSYSEAGTVAAYLNMIPAILPFAAFFALGIKISANEIVGMIILIFSSTIICLLDNNLSVRWKSFGLIFFVCLLQVFAYLIEEIIFETAAFFPVFLIITSGIIFTGLLPLFFKGVRRDLSKNSHKLLKLAKFFVVIEIVNLLALFSVQSGINLGIAPLVAAVETTVPAFTFILSVLLMWLLNKKIVIDKMHFKIPVIALMAFGVLIMTI